MFENKSSAIHPKTSKIIETLIDRYRMKKGPKFCEIRCGAKKHRKENTKAKKLSSGRCEFGDGLSSLRDGMLRELAGKNKFNCSLNLP